MKKQLSVIIGALAILSANDAPAATNWGTRAGSSANLSGTPSTRTRESINYKKYKTVYIKIGILIGLIIFIILL